MKKLGELENARERRVDGRQGPVAIAKAMRVMREKPIACARCSALASFVGRDDQLLCTLHYREDRAYRGVSIEAARERLRRAMAR